MITTHSVTINATSYQFSQMKILIPEVDPLLWLETQEVFPKFYWKGREEMAAMGAIASWDFLPELEEKNTSSFMVVGGASFHKGKRKDALWDLFPSAYFFLPEYQLIKDGEQTYLCLNFLDTPPSDAPLSRISFVQSAPLSKSVQPEERVDLPDYPAWEALLNKALQTTGLDKVVLARRTTLTFQQPLSGFSILQELKGRSNARVFFGFQPAKEAAFIGASPEYLYTREGSNITCDAVAATFLGSEGATDLKLKREFGYVKAFLREALSPLCTTLSFQEKETFLPSQHFSHLYDRLEGELNLGVRDRALLETLHPTPAIGGFPRAAARSFIHQEEPFERGWYSAPIGWAKAESASFAVGIRSALVEEKQIHLFAGLGVVEGSLPDKEWEELELKIGHYLR